MGSSRLKPFPPRRVTQQRVHRRHITVNPWTPWFPITRMRASRQLRSRHSQGTSTTGPGPASGYDCSATAKQASARGRSARSEVVPCRRLAGVGADDRIQANARVLSIRNGNICLAARPEPFAIAGQMPPPPTQRLTCTPERGKSRDPRVTVLARHALFALGRVGVSGRAGDRPVLADRAALEPPPAQPKRLHGRCRNPDRGVGVTAAAPDDRIAARTPCARHRPLISTRREATPATSA
jgi:hypothetical protein